MRYVFAVILILPLFFSCSEKQDEDAVKIPKKVAQWINPLYFNNDFENELNFPLWFNDSLIRAHKIYKITKRVYSHLVGDTNEINSYNEAIPKEKIEYYFDPNGLVDQIVIYMYYDDREIARVNFIYEGNLHASGYRKMRALPLISLTKSPIVDEFTTDFFQDKTNQYNLYDFVGSKGKYLAFMDSEKGNHLFFVKKKKYWGPLSIDSILNPAKEDWVVHGTPRKPYQRYKVDNIVNQSNVFMYQYWKTGVLKRRIKTSYPFEYRRTFTYGENNEWNGYIDSTFTENKFITKYESKIIYDEYQRPFEITHVKFNEENQGVYYRETLYYRTTNKN